MLSSSQYLRPEYMTPLPTTLDSKKSPLALLAQTCSKIGSEPSTTNTNQSKSTATKQPRESSTPLIVHDSKKVKAKPIISTIISSSTTREQRRSKSPREDSKSSPAIVSIKSSSNPATNLNLYSIDEEHMNESAGGENKSSEEKKTDSPFSPSGSNKGFSPSNGREKNKSRTSTPVTASSVDIILSRSPHSETSKNPTSSIDNKNRDNSQSVKLTLNDPLISDSSKCSATSFSNLYYSTQSSHGTEIEIPAYLHSYARLKAASANAQQLLSDPVPVYQTFPRKCPDPYCSGHTSTNSLESKCCGQQQTTGQSHLSAFHNNNLSNFLLIPPPSFPHHHHHHHNLNESLFGYPTTQAPLPPPLLSSSQALHNLNLNLSLQAHRAYSSPRYHPYGKSIFGSYSHLPLPLSLQSYYPYSIFGQRLPSNHP